MYGSGKWSVISFICIPPVKRPCAKIGSSCFRLYLYVLRNKYVLNMKSIILIKLALTSAQPVAVLCKRVVFRNLYVFLVRLKGIALGYGLSKV